MLVCRTCIRSWRSVPTTVALVIVLATQSITWTAAAAQATGSTSPKVLVTVSGKAFTVKGISGISYRQGLRICNKAFRQWSVNGKAWRWIGGPMVVDYDTNKPPPPFRSGTEIYNNALTGMMRIILEREVRARLIAKYHVKMSKYIIPGAAQAEVRKHAKGDWLVRRQIDGILVKGWNRDDYSHHVAAMFPNKMIPTSDNSTVYKWITSAPVAHYCIYHAFPGALSPHKAAPWVMVEERSDYAGVAIGDIVLRKRKIFAHLAAKYGGQWHYELIRNAPEGRRGEVAIRRLLGATTLPKGSCDALALHRAVQVLKVLGSSTRIGDDRASGPMIGFMGIARHWYGIPDAQFSTGKLLPVKIKAALNRSLHNLQYIYVYPRSDKYWKQYMKGPFGPPSGLFQTYATFLLTPIAEEVLKQSKPMKGLSLPATQTLVQAMLDCGQSRPKLFKRMPWPLAASKDKGVVH